MALDFPLGLAALRLAVNLARFTKTPGMGLLAKAQICSSCFGSTNLGHLASFNLRTALHVIC